MEIDENDNEEDIIKDTLKKKEGLISFSKINKYYLFPFLCAILLTINGHFFNSNIKVEEDEQITKEKKTFMIKIIESLYYIILGIFYFIPSFGQKIKNTKKDAIEYPINERTSSSI